MAAISASVPVVSPAVPSVTYNEWYLTQLFGKFSPTVAPCSVQLTRSATVNNASVLMPPGTNSTVNFNFDLWKEAAADPAIATLAATAQESLLALVVALATKRKLL